VAYLSADDVAACPVAIVQALVQNELRHLCCFAAASFSGYNQTLVITQQLQQLGLLCIGRQLGAVALHPAVGGRFLLSGPVLTHLRMQHRTWCQRALSLSAEQAATPNSRTSYAIGLPSMCGARGLLLWNGEW
jgi:hypothetical protein